MATSFRHWTEEEDRALVDWGVEFGPSALAERMNRLPVDVAVRMAFLGVRKPQPQPQLQASASAAVPVVTFVDPVQVAPQAPASVVVASSSGSSKVGRGRAWTPADEEAFHAAIASGADLKDAAAAIGRSVHACRAHISAPIIKAKAAKAANPAPAPKTEPAPVPAPPKPKFIPKNEDPEPGWMRVAEFVRESGANQSRIYALCASGKIKARKGRFGRYEIARSELGNDIIKAVLQPQAFARWTPAEDSELVAAFTRGRDAEIAKVFQGRRTLSACRTRLSMLQKRGVLGDAVIAAAKASGRPVHRPWTEADDALLARDWRPGNESLLAVKLSRLPESIAMRARVLRLGMDSRHRPWTAGDDARLQEYWYQATIPELAVMLERTEESVETRATVLKLPPHRPMLDAPVTAAEAVGLAPACKAGRWSREQDEALRGMFADGDPVSEMAVALGRPDKEIRARIGELGLKAAPALRKPGAVWTSEEDEILRRMSSLGAERLAVKLNRPEADVQARMDMVCVSTDGKRGWRGQRRLVALGMGGFEKVKGAVGAGRESVTASSLEESGSGLDMGEKLAILRSLAAGGTACSVAG